MSKFQGGFEMENETKKCKYCQTDIPKKAKVCPNCKKKQGGGVAKWIVIVVVVIFALAAASGGSGDDKDKNPQKVSETTNENVQQATESTTQIGTKEAATQEVSNVFHAGDVIETEDFKISFLSSAEYVSDNQFLQPKDGYVYWLFEFSFENISSTDQTVSSLIDWECYADNSKVDQTWIGDDNGLDATLSSGRTTKGTIYFEVPKDAQTIELEYKVNYWNSDKIIFVGK